MIALIDDYADFQDKLELRTQWRGDVSHLDATAESLRHRLAKTVDDVLVNEFVAGIRAYMDKVL